MPPKKKSTAPDAAALAALETIRIPSDPLPPTRAHKAPPPPPVARTGSPRQRTSSQSRAMSTARRNAEHTREMRRKRIERDLYRQQGRDQRQRSCVIVLVCTIICVVAIWGTQYALRTPNAK